MTVSIPDVQALMETRVFVPLVRYNVTATWIEIAIAHRDRALRFRDERNVAWSGIDEDLKARALENELEASMQAIVAIAIALDALYAVLVPHIQVSQADLKAWRQSRTARSGQVADVIRRAFRLSNGQMRALRQDLRPIFQLRDSAVHPEGRLVEAHAHPELDVGTDPRFGWFRATNADTVVLNGSWIIWTLVHDGRAANEGVLDVSGALRDRLRGLFPDGHPRQPNTKN